MNLRRLAVPFSDLNFFFCLFDIPQPMQWPARLNLQTSTHGEGIFVAIDGLDAVLICH